MDKGEKIGKIWFSTGIPPEVLATCKETLIKYDYLIPSWCNEVRVYYDAQGQETEGSSLVSACIDTNYAYRFASLFICPPFLMEEPEDRVVRLIHELSHIVTAPLLYYIRDIVGIISKEDETFSELVSRESTEKSEAVTEDLAQIFYKAAKVNEPQPLRNKEGNIVTDKDGNIICK